jgi:predicted metal-binding membrane protein
MALITCCDCVDNFMELIEPLVLAAVLRDQGCTSNKADPAVLIVQHLKPILQNLRDLISPLSSEAWNAGCCWSCMGKSFKDCIMNVTGMLLPFIYFSTIMLTHC